MENEDKYERPTELIGVTNTVTFKINGQDEIHVPDVTDVNDKYPSEGERESDTDQDINSVAEVYKYNLGRKIKLTTQGTDFDDGEVIDSSSLTDEESEWTGETESPILSDEHVKRDTTTQVTQLTVKRKDFNNKRKHRKMSKTGRIVKQLESNLKKIRQELEGMMKRIARQEIYNAVSRVISQIPTTDRKIANYTTDQKTSCGIKKKGNEISKSEISNWKYLNISDILRSNSSDAASVIAKYLLKMDNITYPIKMFIQSRDSLSRLEYVRLVQFDTDIDREDPKYPPLKAIPTSPIEISSGNSMANSQLATITGTAHHTSDINSVFSPLLTTIVRASMMPIKGHHERFSPFLQCFCTSNNVDLDQVTPFEDVDDGQQRSCGSPLTAITQNINMRSMICVVQYQRGCLFRGSAGGIQQTNVILITCEMIELILNHNILSSVFNIPGAIPNVVECFNRWSCVNEISINFQRLVQFYKSSLKMSPENSRNRMGSNNFTFERQVQPSVDMIPKVRNAMEPPSFKQIDHSSMEPQERTNGHSLLIREPLTSSVMSVKKPDMNLSAAGGVRKKSRTKDRKHRMNRIKLKRKQLVGISLSDRSYTHKRKGIVGEYCVANSQRKGKRYQKGTPDLNKGFFNGHQNRLSRDQSEYTENYRKVRYESEYHCESGFTDNNVSQCSHNSVGEEEEVQSYERLTSNSRKGVISNGIEERCDISDIHNDDESNLSSIRMRGRLLNTHPTDDSCRTEMCTSFTPHFAYHVPYTGMANGSIPPEGGTSGNVVLINTCPIDGFLFMIFLVLNSDPDRRNKFEDSDNELEKIYFGVWHSFKQNNFGNGKVLWCWYGGSISNEEIGLEREIRVDIKGTEDKRIFSVLGKNRLVVECRCSNQDCPDDATKHTELYRVLPIYAKDGEILSDTIRKGFRNFLWRDMGHCTNRKRNGEKCAGTRRQSFVDPPFIFPVNLYFLQFGGKTFNSSDIPEKVEHNDLIYDLRLVRFYRNNHFVEKIKVDDVWMDYDNSHEQLYYFEEDLEGDKLSSCYYIKRRQNL